MTVYVSKHNMMFIAKSQIRNAGVCLILHRKLLTQNIKVELNKLCNTAIVVLVYNT